MIYLNDFSSADALTGLETQGNWRVQDGTLETQGTGGSAFLTYTLPAAFAGKDFRVEVDFLGHTSTGGILIGGIGDGLAKAPTSFFGYDCFIGANGKKTVQQTMETAKKVRSAATMQPVLGAEISTSVKIPNCRAICIFPQPCAAMS